MTATPFQNRAAIWTSGRHGAQSGLLVAGLAALAAALVWACLAAALHAFGHDALTSAEDRFGTARTSEDLAAAGALAQRALVGAPDSATPLRILGFIADREGNLGAARTLMQAAGARSHRDLLTQAWLFDDAVRRDDYPTLFERADATLRLDDGMEPALYPSMIRAAADPRAMPSLLAHLEARPPWRGDFLNAVAASADPAVSLTVLRALKQTSAPATDDETGALVNRLVRDGDLGKAYAAWAALLPKGTLAHPGDLYDGDFAPAPGAAPFNWRLNADPAVVAERSQPPSGPAHALYVRYEPTEPIPLASQMLLLPAGAYRLSGQVMFESSSQDGQLHWTLYCGGGWTDPLADIAETGEAGAWRPFSMRFIVPSGAGCAAQRLQLSGRAGEGFDSVGAWFTAFRVQRVGAGAR
ncbi:MAG TPA: hypothetical protein VJP88_08270 [Caulobacteraceae bacterium]|nr:hypothetical protein [Caulobacteraceae bacterium]